MIPAAGADPRHAGALGGALGRRENWQVASGTGLPGARALLLLRAWGLWFGDAIVWPLVLAGGGGALIWRQSQGARGRRRPARRARPGGGAGSARLRLARRRWAPRASARRSWSAAALVFLWLNGALVAATATSCSPCSSSWSRSR